MFEVFARLPLSAGAEAVISYGETLSNAELQERYGFVVPGNPNGETKKPKRDPYA